ncbi:hypothetical protein K440DRAFT_189713 [Wilcoxina mikolae CBS 423.85]|nr:hypothetical protein K440DRAFT_189713 [Wilcoxina mikolae CBS 423.85]
MLERVAVHHLESGGLRLLRGGRPRKRMLHSAFWVHGGGELDLAAAAASLFGGGGCCGEEGGSTETTPTLQQQLLQANSTWRRADSIHLDFLYPSGALSFLRYLGRAVPRREGSPMFSIGGGKREYSSSTQLPPSEVADPDHQPQERPLPITRAVPEPGLERPEDDNFAGLDEFMKSPQPGRYESAWYHYWNSKSATSKEAKTVRRHFISRYMLQSNHKQEWIRILSLLTLRSPKSWTNTDYESVVKCYIRLDHPERALEVLKNNVEGSLSSRNSGFEAFIRFYVLRERWDLVMEAWRILRGAENGIVRDRNHDRIMHLDTTALPCLRDPENFPKFVERIVRWADTIPVRKRRGHRAPPLDDELAETLMKSCLSYITRPEAPWMGVLWENTWYYIRRRPGWIITKSDWERTISYLAGTFQDEKSTYRYSRFRVHDPKNMSLDVMNKVLRCYARLEDLKGMQMVWDDILVFSDVGRPNRESYSILMAALARRGDSAGVHELLRRYTEEFIPETPQELSHIMQAHVERGELRDVVLWFERMLHEYGIKPDVISYNILINVHRKVGDVDGAARRVQEMLDRGLKPDTTTYNILLKMCASRGDVAGAENIFNLIKQSGLRLDPYAYEALASAYVAVKDMDKAEAILKQVAEQSFDISPTPIWNTVLSAHAAMGNDERVNQIFELMHQREVPFDYYTYGIVMHCLCLAGKMESAEQTLTYMKEAKFHINTDKYAILMVGYLRLGDFRMVWETFKRMLDDGLKADFKTLAVLLKSYAHAEVEEDSDMAGDMVHLKATEKTLDEITAEVRDLDLTSFDSVKSATPPWLFTPLINVYFHKSAWDRAINIFARFLRVSAKEEYGASPNLQMYKLMMRVYHAGGDVEGVRHMWEGLKATAVQLHKAIDLKLPNHRTILEVYRNEVCSALSILIRAMARTKDIGIIDEEVKSIQGFGYELDNVNWNDYVQAMVLAGDLAKAAEVCEKNLMSRWNDVRLYFFYQDPTMRGEEGKELPAVRPFIRTIEAVATELRALEELRKRGDPIAKTLLVDIYRNAPTTWEACDGLEDLEGRASKEMMFRLQKSGEEQMVGGDGRGGGGGYY